MIRETLKGYHLDNQDLSNEFMYWFFAHNFNFTQEQVDDLPYDSMVYMFELEQEMKRIENQQ